MPGPPGGPRSGPSRSELYRQLTQWADSAAIALDVPRVALADAVRAMIRVTAEDPGAVLERLRLDREA
jgi:hypothetical protein